jgi:putative lipase involved disintegration of autophagic bodies
MGINAHAGFLNSALELLLVLSEQIEQIVRHNPSTKLLFTGHSAGGATATLLYLAFRSRMAATCMFNVCFDNTTILY